MRLVAVAVGLALVVAPSASALCPNAVPGFGLDDVAGQRGAALGLVVPDAGPVTSQRRALASLVRGKVVNSLHGELPSGPARIGLCLPSRDAAVGVPAGGEQPNDRRYAVMVTALARYGGRPALLTSTSTRIPGLISIADIAHEERLGVQPHPDAVRYLRELDERIRENGNARLPAGLLATAIIAAFVWALPRAAILAFATVAATNLVLGAAGISEPWLVVVLLALGTLAAVPLAAVLRSRLAVGLALAAALGAYLAALGADHTWVSLSPLGPSQNGRFYGLSNLLATLLLVPALAGAALLGRRLGPLAFAAVALAALVTVGGSRFGADGGGAVVLAAAYAVLAALLFRLRLRAAAAVGAALLGVAALDVLAGPATHVGRSLREGALASDVADRLVLSWERATASLVVALVVAASIAALVALVARLPRLRLPREAAALPVAFAVAIGVSLLVNDSPREVAVLGLVGYLVLERWLRADGAERATLSAVEGAEAE